MERALPIYASTATRRRRRGWSRRRRRWLALTRPGLIGASVTLAAVALQRLVG